MLKYFPTYYFGFYSNFKNLNLEEDHRRDVNILKKKHTAVLVVEEAGENHQPWPSNW
jgi:hypothetical protein